jgi:hypothetical protein
MQLYYGTHLDIDKDKKFSITIPENIIITSDFAKYKNDMNVYLIAPKKTDINEIYTDEIQACITPYTFDEFKRLHFIELQMNNVHGALSKFLELFSEENINIHECRAIDSVLEMKGKVELLATIGIELLRKYNAKDIQAILREKYTKKIKKDPRLWNDFESITIERTNSDFISEYEDKKYFTDEGIYTIYQNSDDTEYRIQLPQRILEKLHISDKIFLGVTYESKGNYLIVKFKSVSEIIVPIEIQFKSNEKGRLEKIIRPLSDIGVNLRLITPMLLSEKPIYKIYFNIENTKLKYYNRNIIENILKEHFPMDIIEYFHIDKYFEFDEGESPINKNYISESDKNFKKHINDEIQSKWINKLKQCNDNCLHLDCILNRNWNQTRNDISNLIEQIINAKLNEELISNIPEKLYTIKENEKKSCEYQSEFKLLLQHLNNYLNNNNSNSSINPAIST